MSVVADIAATVRADDQDGVRLIGIDGPSGSGKSTLARRVAAELDAPIVEIDDFVAWDDFSGWWPRFDEAVLRPLLAGDDLRYQVRDWANDEFGRSLGPWKSLAWQRDGEDFRPLWERWMAQEAAFFAADDTRSRADVVVDGTAPVD
jgi:hypothetical protein